MECLKPLDHHGQPGHPILSHLAHGKLDLLVSHPCGGAQCFLQRDPGASHRHAQGEVNGFALMNNGFDTRQPCQRPKVGQNQKIFSVLGQRPESVPQLFSQLPHLFSILDPGNALVDRQAGWQMFHVTIWDTGRQG